MSVNISQDERVAITMAELVHYALCWDEPMNGDRINDFTNSFKKELKQLNGENK